MFSNIFSRFGAKPKSKSIVPRPTIERTDWYVLQPLQTLRFEDKAWGLQWCKQHGLAPHALQERLINLDEASTIAQASALDNMFEIAKKGNGFGSIPEDTCSTHLDNYFAAFKMQPQINTTGSLLAMAFSVNRVDVAQYIGSLLARNVAHWLEPLVLQPYEDPVLVEDANNAFMKSFKTMMQRPRQMQWFFEHNPMLYAQLSTEKNVAKLESDIVRSSKARSSNVRGSNLRGSNVSDSNESRLIWPLVASTIFAHDVHPVSQDVPYYWILVDPETLNTLLISYTHDPAAQCTLMRMPNRQDWFYGHETGCVSMEHANRFLSPECIALRKYFRQESLSGVDADVVKRVHLLTMGLHKDTHEAFYQHAQLIFAPAPLLTLNLPELEAGVW